MELTNINKSSVMLINDDGKQLTFMNSSSSRIQLKKIVSEEAYAQILDVWGDNLTIPDIIPLDDKAFQELRTATLERLRQDCNVMITKGFDIELDDGSSHHFSLEIDDQLKIQALALKAQSGQTELPYHADNEPCRFFSPSEIISLNTMMEHIITYNTTYLNSLNTYINSITDYTSLKSVYYGMDIPQEYQSDVFKSLISANSEVSLDV